MREYGTLTHGLYHDSLRSLLQRLGILNWIEITAGSSWAGYRALDAYIKIYSGGMTPPEEEAWFVLNLEVPVQQRRMFAPEYWYYCRNWYSMGQRTSISEHILLDLRGMVPYRSML